ncbi:hypothetical protein Tco_0834644 [Tanacetum coccineum]
MRKQQVLDLVLGGNQRVEFSRLFVLDGFQQERHSPLSIDEKDESEPTHGQDEQISQNQCESKQALNVSAGTLLSTGTSFNPTEEGLRRFGCEKEDIHKNRASRNFDLMITMTPRSSMFKRRLIAADQASVFMEMMSVHISSGLVLHQMTSDHNRSELGIHDHSNEPSSSKLVPKVVP